MRAGARAGAILVLAAMGAVRPSSSRAEVDRAMLARAMIEALDYGLAASLLTGADDDDPGTVVERARLSVYQLDCDGAVGILARPAVRSFPGAEGLAEIARGCQRVTAGLTVDRDDRQGIEVHWQDEHDRALAPLLFDTVVLARDTLSNDLGVDWPRPTRIVVVRDLLSLSAMTGLPYSSAQMTGTVAVAKWGRVTLLSPRASQHGFAWRDTVAHELAHLAVTRATRDRAPLWLQEGIAKREEVRWRAPTFFDDRPPADAMVKRALELGTTLHLDRLGPSIAMLPSAAEANTAFAEVTSFVRFYTVEGGDAALPRLLSSLKHGTDPDEALVSASGADFKTWDGRWRAHVAALPHPASDDALGAGTPGSDSIRRVVERRDRSRLAQLLLSRGHSEEALVELDRMKESTADPSVRWLRGRALEASGRRQEGELLVASPSDVETSYGPWWAMRGRWARLRGEGALSEESFVQALSADPLDAEVACESVASDAPPPGPRYPALCEIARARGLSEFDAE
jgi:hypothetical protein